MAEPIERALVDWPGGLAVDLHRSVGHHTVENKPDALAFPLARHGETQPIESMLVCFRAGTLAVVVSAEALLLPVRWHLDGSPLAGAAALGDGKLPRHRIFRTVAREVAQLRFLRHRRQNADG